MAGAPAGYRTFTAGEVLTAANVQNYLQDQVIPVFANNAAATAVMTAPAEGQFRFLKDTDAFEVFTGSAWVAAGGGAGGGFEQTFMLMGA
jgi:hypothetical protein